MNNITIYFNDVETEKEYDGYYYSVAEAITIVILGTICGLRNMSQIHQWATSEKNSEFLREEFGISRIPCYYWFLSLMKLVKPESLNHCFMEWVTSIMPDKIEPGTIALDGKTIRSTAKMKKHETPLHIISAQLCEMGLTFAQKSVDGKSNEIPAVQELLKELNIKNCMIVADAMHCQKETAKIVIDGRGDYLLSVKRNQRTLFSNIQNYIQNENYRSDMFFTSQIERNSGRIEVRTGYVTNNITWLDNRNLWKGIKVVGAIHTEITTSKGTCDEWHYYISSRNINAEELLHHARMEWSVETMHWMLDVHYAEDFCRIEDKNIHTNLNMLRKCALNLIKNYKTKHNSKSALSRIMFNCLLDSKNILDVIFEN